MCACLLFSNEQQQLTTRMNWQLKIFVKIEERERDCFWCFIAIITEQQQRERMRAEKRPCKHVRPWRLRAAALVVARSVENAAEFTTRMYCK